MFNDWHLEQVVCVRVCVCVCVRVFIIRLLSLVAWTFLACCQFNVRYSHPLLFSTFSACQRRLIFTMEVTNKGMTMTSNSFNKSNGYYLFHQSPKTIACRLFKEAFWNYSSDKLSWSKILKVYARIQPKWFLSWHWKSVK